MANFAYITGGSSQIDLSTFTVVNIGTRKTPPSL